MIESYDPDLRQQGRCVGARPSQASGQKLNCLQQSCLTKTMDDLNGQEPARVYTNMHIVASHQITHAVHAEQVPDGQLGNSAPEWVALEVDGPGEVGVHEESSQLHELGDVTPASSGRRKPAPARVPQQRLQVRSIVVAPLRQVSCAPFEAARSRQQIKAGGFKSATAVPHGERGVS